MDNYALHRKAVIERQEEERRCLLDKLSDITSVLTHLTQRLDRIEALLMVSALKHPDEK